jgi:hypothetical protein
MRINLTVSEIQTILNALEKETIHNAVATREKIWLKVKQDSKKVGNK